MTLELEVRSPLAGFSLDLTARATGRSIAVLGPSGAGKTTLLEVIAGLRPARGRVVVDGEVLLDSARGLRVAPERRRVGYVPQDALLFPHLTVKQNIGYAGKGARVDDAICLLELSPLLARFPRTLSGGERQRVALARAIAASPRLLLLDEPLAALDVELKERILPYLVRVRDELDVPLVYVTHQLGEALAIAAEAWVLAKGKLLHAGPPREVLRSPLMLEGSVENICEGLVLEGRPAQVALKEGGTLVVPARPAPGPCVYAVSADDVLLAPEPPGPLSARNALEGTLQLLQPASDDDVLATVDVRGKLWVARLTEAATRDLALVEGQRVFLIVKTHSLRRLR